MDKMRSYLVTFLLILTILVGGCAQSTENQSIDLSIEGKIYLEATEVANDFPYKSDGKLIIEKGSNSFTIYPEDFGKENAIKLAIPSDFYEFQELYVPEIIEEKFPEKYLSIYSNARDMAIEYIEDSSIIREVDKPLCIEDVKNISFHYGVFCNQMDSNILMFTEGNDIYINSALASHLSEYYLLHEIIHVISNRTNSGSTYELSCYRASKFNEAMTDVITYQICLENEIPVDTLAYGIYMEMPYLAIEITQGDILEAYYYSDEYEQIIEKAGQDIFDVIILTTDNYKDEMIWNLSPYMVTEFRESY